MGSLGLDVDGFGGGGGIVEPGAAAADARDGDKPEGQRQQQGQSPTRHGGQTHREMTKCLAAPLKKSTTNDSLLGRAELAMGMTTVWRPHVRINVVNVSDVDVNEECRDALTTKGTKRKRAPPHKGPC